MAFPYLTLPETLRPWHGQGLHLLLIQPDAESAVAETQEASVAAAEAQADSGEVGQASFVSPSALTDHESSDPPVREQWARLLERLPQTSRCVLTYHELAFDMAGRPDPVRRDFLRRLLAGLSQPRGTLTFWPVGLAGEGAEGVCFSPQYFHKGLSRLNADVIFVFGCRCSEVLGLDHRNYSCTCVAAGGSDQRRYCFLPELHEFISEPSSMTTLIDFILASLAS